MGKQLGPKWEAQVGPIWGISGIQLGPIWAFPLGTQIGPIWEVHVAPYGVNMGAAWPDIAIPFRTQFNPVISPVATFKSCNHFYFK